MEKGEDVASEESGSSQAQRNEADTVGATEHATNGTIELQEPSMSLPVLANTAIPSATPTITRTEIPDSDDISDFSSPVKLNLNNHLTAASPPNFSASDRIEPAKNDERNEEAVQDEAPLVTTNIAEPSNDVPASSPPFMIGIPSSPMSERKQATAIAFAAAAVNQLEDSFPMSTGGTTEEASTLSEETRRTVESINRPPVLISLPELEFVRTAMEPGSTNTEDSTIFVNAPPAIGQIEQQEVEPSIPAEADDMVSTLGAASEEPNHTPVELPNDDSQHFNEAYREIMGTQKVSSSDITASQATKVNGDLASVTHANSGQSSAQSHEELPTNSTLQPETPAVERMELSDNHTNVEVVEDTAKQNIDSMVSEQTELQPVTSGVPEAGLDTLVDVEVEKDASRLKGVVETELPLPSEEDRDERTTTSLEVDSVTTLLETQDHDASETPIVEAGASKIDDSIPLSRMIDQPDSLGTTEIMDIDQDAQKDEPDESPSMVGTETHGLSKTGNTPMSEEENQPKENLSIPSIENKHSSPPMEVQDHAQAQPQIVHNMKEYAMPATPEETGMLTTIQNEKVESQEGQAIPTQDADTEMTEEEVLYDPELSTNDEPPTSVLDPPAEQDLPPATLSDSPKSKKLEILDSDDESIGEAISFERIAANVTRKTIGTITTSQKSLDHKASVSAILDSDTGKGPSVHSEDVVMTDRDEESQELKKSETSTLLNTGGTLVAVEMEPEVPKGHPRVQKRVNPDGSSSTSTSVSSSSSLSLPLPLLKPGNTSLTVPAENIRAPAITPTISEIPASEVVLTSSSSQGIDEDIPAVRKQPIKTPHTSFKLPSFSKDKNKDSPTMSSSPVKESSSTESPFVLQSGDEASKPSRSNDVVLAELKAMKIASIKARNATLLAEIAAKRAKLEEVTKTLRNLAAETVKTHIKLLHDYNDIRDVGQGLIGLIADQKGVRIGELYEEFGVSVKD